MIKMDKKFISFSQAMQEILDDFKSEPKQYDLFAKVYSFLAGGEAITGEEKCPPFGINMSAKFIIPSRSTAEIIQSQKSTRCELDAEALYEGVTGRHSE